VSAHTPGPWEQCGTLVRTCRNADGSGGFLVAETPANIGQRIEDARLIAAAPELLEVLKAARFHVRRDCDWSLLQRVDDAIAKAERAA